jgi:hypothetical protein
MPALQYWFTGAALAAFIALATAAVTLGYNWYRAATAEMESASNKTASIAQKRQTARIKDLLGIQMDRANALLKKLSNADPPQVEQEAIAWGQQTHDLIEAAYGTGEAGLFLDSSGYVFYSDGSDKSRIRNWIDGRKRRLSELLQRADLLTAKEGFEAQKFE